MSHVRQLDPMNLLDPLPDAAVDEVITALLQRPGVRIERIVSRGHVTPADTPYEQDHAEWVLLLAGAATVWIEGDGELALRAGDSLLIPARRRHRVSWTQAEPPTVWLAVHLAGD